MSTNDQRTTNFCPYNNQEHLEIFSIIWLEKYADVKENEETRQKLRYIINHLRTFDDSEACKQYIEQRSENARLVLIVSSEFSRTFVPAIHKFQQVSSIYIHSNENTSDQEWAKDFFKVRLVQIILQYILLQFR